MALFKKRPQTTSDTSLFGSSGREHGYFPLPMVVVTSNAQMVLRAATVELSRASTMVIDCELLRDIDQAGAAVFSGLASQAAASGKKLYFSKLSAAQYRKCEALGLKEMMTGRWTPRRFDPALDGEPGIINPDSIGDADMDAPTWGKRMDSARSVYRDTTWGRALAEGQLPVGHARPAAPSPQTYQAPKQPGRAVASYQPASAAPAWQADDAAVALLDSASAAYAPVEDAQAAAAAYENQVFSASCEAIHQQVCSDRRNEVLSAAFAQDDNSASWASASSEADAVTAEDALRLFETRSTPQQAVFAASALPHAASPTATSLAPIQEPGFFDADDVIVLEPAFAELTPVVAERAPDPVVPPVAVSADLESTTLAQIMESQRAALAEADAFERSATAESVEPVIESRISGRIGGLDAPYPEDGFIDHLRAA